MDSAHVERESEAVSPKDSTTATTAAPIPDETEERTRINRNNEILLTSSSILAGFALTGLVGLADIGKDGLEALADAIAQTPSPLAFPVAHFSMLFASICFVGVVMSIVRAKLQRRDPSLRSLRYNFRAAVLVFGVGLAALFCATVTIGLPTGLGSVIGLVGGGAVAAVLIYRALIAR